MKNLTIKAENCVIEKGINALSINGEYIEQLITKNLPGDMVNHKPYAGTIHVSINIETEDAAVKITGYKKVEGGDKDAGSNNSDSDNESISRG